VPTLQEDADSATGKLGTFGRLDHRRRLCRRAIGILLPIVRGGSITAGLGDSPSVVVDAAGVPGAAVEP